MKRLVKIGVTVLALTASTAALAIPAKMTKASAPAAPTASTPANEAAWKVVCPEKQANGTTPPCSLVQNLVAGEQKQRLLTVIVQRKDQGHILTVALPHGVFFPAGVAVQIDDAPELKLVVESSDQNGAYTGTPVDEAMLKALKGGKTLKVSFTAGNGQRIMVPVTLKDFGLGLAELDKKQPPKTAASRQSRAGRRA